MPSYRIYVLQPDGQIAAPSRDVVCCDDNEVLSVAQGMMPGDAVPEIWQGTRRVCGYHGTIARQISTCLLTQ